MNPSETPSEDTITRYLAVDEEGYFVFDKARVTDPAVGLPLIEAIQPDEGGRFTTQMMGQKAWLEPYDAPLVARHFTSLSAELGQIDLCYGGKAQFPMASLSVDEWDRFHGVTTNQIPFIFSRQAQTELFDRLEAFDDESITLNGLTLPVSSWLNPSPDAGNSRFWNDLYKTAATGWELNRESVVLPQVLPQLKLNRCRVLVLGCGSGHDAAYFAKQGHVVTAVDFSAEATQRARQNYSSLDNLSIVQADAFQPHAEWNERFDIVFEHTFYCAISPEKRNALVQIWNRALTPQGHLLGVFFAMEKRTGPPFGGSEAEISKRLSKYFVPLYWTRWRNSLPARQAQELLVYARKKERP